MHQKRQTVPKTWPIERKGTKYVVRASHANSKAIPLLIVLRDVLKLANNRKEVKYMLNAGEVLVNNKVRKDEQFPVQVFDVVKIEKLGKVLRMEIISKKLRLKEIDGKEGDKKITKVVGKKLMSKKKIQMNLEDGQNFLSTDNFQVGDSVVINTKENKVEKVLGLKKGAKVEVIKGKHAGKKGVFEETEDSVKGKRYAIKLESGVVSFTLDNILVIE